MIDVIRATTPTQFDMARGLIHEYFLTWGVDEVTDPELLQELATLETHYPVVVVATIDGATAGVVAFYEVDDTDICEMKRMFVRPGARRLGVGRALTRALMLEAQAQGFARMRLDTPTFNDPALAMYRSLGFEPIDAFYEVPPDGHIQDWTFLGTCLVSDEAPTLSR